MSRSTRMRRGAVAWVLMLWSQACVTSRPMSANASIPSDAEIHIRSSSPFELTRQTDSLPAVKVCCVTAVTGKLVRVAGDTVVIARGSGYAVMSDGTRVGGVDELTVVRTSETEVTVRRVDGTRTMLLLVGIAAVLFGLAALAASQMEFGFPDSGGGTFLRQPAGPALR